MLELVKEHYVLTFILGILTLATVESCVIAVAKAFKRK